MHLERRIRGHAPVDGIEKVPELHAPVALMQVAQHRPGLEVLGGEKVARSVRDVVMTVPLDLLDEQRIARELKRRPPMRRQGEGAPEGLPQIRLTAV